MRILDSCLYHDVISISACEDFCKLLQYDVISHYDPTLIICHLCRHITDGVVFCVSMQQQSINRRTFFSCYLNLPAIHFKLPTVTVLSHFWLAVSAETLGCLHKLYGSQQYLIKIQEKTEVYQTCPTLYRFNSLLTDIYGMTGMIAAGYRYCKQVYVDALITVFITVLHSYP